MRVKAHAHGPQPRCTPPLIVPVPRVHVHTLLLRLPIRTSRALAEQSRRRHGRRFVLLPRRQPVCRPACQSACLSPRMRMRAPVVWPNGRENNGNKGVLHGKERMGGVGTLASITAWRDRITSTPATAYAGQGGGARADWRARVCVPCRRSKASWYPKAFKKGRQPPASGHEVDYTAACDRPGACSWLCLLANNSIYPGMRASLV